MNTKGMIDSNTEAGTTRRYLFSAERGHSCPQQLPKGRAARVFLSIQSNRLAADRKVRAPLKTCLRGLPRAAGGTIETGDYTSSVLSGIDFGGPKGIIMAEEIVKLAGAVEVTESGGNRMKTQGAFHIQLANGDASLLCRSVDCKHPVPSGATDRDGRASLNQGGRSSTAFTLHEVLVSVFLGAMMLTALYSAFTFGFSTVKTEREDLRATQILVEQMVGLS